MANQLLTALALAPWDSGAQPRLILALIRSTYGLNRTEAPIGLSSWRKLTGLSDRAIETAKRSLEKNGVILLVRDFHPRNGTPQVWKLQKDFTRWGKYAVSLPAEQAAASVATSHLRKDTPPSSAGGAEKVPPRTLRGGSEGAGGEGTEAAGGEGTSSAGGAPSEPLRPNGSRPPKDKERQGKTGELPVSIETEPGGSSEDGLSWGEFAGWFRTEGHQELWGGAEPPEWADGWDLSRDLDILRKLHRQGWDLEMLQAIILQAEEPSTMQTFWQNGRRDRLERARAGVLRAQEIQGQKIGNILRTAMGAG